MSPEKKAVITASFTAVLLIAIKTAAWIMTWSMAILTSAIDSTLDFFVSMMNFFAIKKSEEPVDQDHNYWHWKIEWFWALFEWIIIFISWLSIIYFSAEKIINNDVLQKTDESIYVMIISVIITFLLVKFLAKTAKETNSLIIKSDLLHYKTDLITNFWIIISLIIIKLLDFPVIDPIISIAIAFYIMYWSIEIFKEWIDMLMDRAIEDKYIDFIKNTVLEHKEIESFHLLKTRKSWKKIFVEFHIVFINPEISLRIAHTISDEIETKVLNEISNSEVMIHLDYFDDSNEPNNPKFKNV
ncbi:MAG: Cation efflux protein [uncultured bacterium (gcode 4)]|uniref:Cation efflux protein n=1 Tax=uncultured bacterium (gcode 4) TaxID=1234023 RepID=K2G866_9BACT|nr:MAG: Cation efflux protein [uncultured bacterium (gcode 4)]